MDTLNRVHVPLHWVAGIVEFVGLTGEGLSVSQPPPYNRIGLEFVEPVHGGAVWREVEILGPGPGCRMASVTAASDCLIWAALPWMEAWDAVNEIESPSVQPPVVPRPVREVPMHIQLCYDGVNMPLP